MPDANEIARQYEQRQRERDTFPSAYPKATQARLGTFSYWQNVAGMTAGFDPETQSTGVTVQVLDGLIVVTDENGDREIISPALGSYMNFVPDRAGE